MLPLRTSFAIVSFWETVLSLRLYTLFKQELSLPGERYRWNKDSIPLTISPLIPLKTSPDRVCGCGCVGVCDVCEIVSNIGIIMSGNWNADSREYVEKIWEKIFWEGGDNVTTGWRIGWMVFFPESSWAAANWVMDLHGRFQRGHWYAAVHSSSWFFFRGGFSPWTCRRSVQYAW